MAGLTAQHWLTPDWDPHLTIAQLSLPHLTAHGLKAAVIDVDRTLLPGRDVTLPGPAVASVQQQPLPRSDCCRG